MYNPIWYKTLIKPHLTPPAWVFAPVWAMLYTLIFLSFSLYAIKSYDNSKNWGYVLFFTQLILNFCWSPIFFNLHNIGFALAIIITMDIIVFLNIIEFFKVSKTAGLLLIPYFIWIIFATYLNAEFFFLN